MKYAVFLDGARQYKVSEGEEILLEHKSGEEKTLKFSEVLLLVEDDKVKVGKPHLTGALIEAEVLGDHKGKKLEVIKYKAKSRYRKHTGHRHLYTRVKIGKITS